MRDLGYATKYEVFLYLTYDPMALFYRLCHMFALHCMLCTRHVVRLSVILSCSMSLNEDQLDGSNAITQNNNNISKPEQMKSAVQIALEQEEQPEPSLYKGGNIQSKSFKLLEQELVGQNSPNGTESEILGYRYFVELSLGSVSPYR